MEREGETEDQTREEVQEEEEEERRRGVKSSRSEGTRNQEERKGTRERDTEGHMTVQVTDGGDASNMDNLGRGVEEGAGVHTHTDSRTDTRGGTGSVQEPCLEKRLNLLSLGEMGAGVAAGNRCSTPEDTVVNGASFWRPPSDTWAPSISETPSFSSSSPNLIPSFSLSSSSSCSPSSTPLPAPSLSPPLPEGTDVGLLLAGGHLVLDVFKGGAAALPSLWEIQQEQLREVQYLRLGSEDLGAIESAVAVLPSLTRLRSLTIRGRDKLSDLLTCSDSQTQTHTERIELLL